MYALVGYMNAFWAILVVVANLISIGLLATLVFPKLRGTAFADFFMRRGVFVAFLVSLLATLGSLVYSDVIGYEPCKLCWFQRIFMFPQVVILGIALWRKDASSIVSCIALSALGGAIALYHYIGQLGFNPLALDCLALGGSSSCSKNFVLEFGYVTIPMMVLSAFILMGLSLLLSTKKS